MQLIRLFHRRILPVLAVVLLPLSALAEPTITKGSRVRLRGDTPLLFGGKEARTGKTGETFTVLQVDPGTGRVFVLAQDAAGKAVAYSVAGEAVEIAPFDPKPLQSAVGAQFLKGDLVAALRLVDGASASAPGEPRIEGMRAGIVALKTAQDAYDKARQTLTSAKQRLAQLERNAQVAARPNALNAADNTGVGRGKEIEGQAEEIRAQAQLAGEQATAALEMARQDLVRILELSPNSAPIPVNLGASIPAVHKLIGQAKSIDELARLMEAQDGTILAAFEPGKAYRMTCKVVFSAAAGIALQSLISDDASLVVRPANPQALANAVFNPGDTINFVGLYQRQEQFGKLILPVFEAYGIQDLATGGLFDTRPPGL